MSYPVLLIPHSALRAIARPLSVGSRLPTLWARRHRTRLVLRDLTRDELADVGLTEAQRTAECAKWFWET